MTVIRCSCRMGNFIINMDISHKLLRKIKEVGYLQIGAGGYDITVSEITRLTERGEDIQKYIRDNDIPYIPTLDEAIDACGENFYGLTRDFKGKYKWRAEISYGTSKRPHLGWGKTRKGAVLRAWLAKNKK